MRLNFNLFLLLPGRRSCIGEILARHEIFIFFAGIIQHFNVLPPEGQTSIEVETMTDSLSVPKPFEIRLISRKWHLQHRLTRQFVLHWLQFVWCTLLQTPKNNQLNPMKEIQLTAFFIGFHWSEQWRSQPKRSGWVRKVWFASVTEGEGFGEGVFAPLPNLENFEKMKPILPSFHAI